MPFAHKLTVKDIKRILYLRGSLKWSLSKIGKKYHIDHSSVLYQIRKYKNGGIVSTAKKVNNTSPETVKVKLPKIKPTSYKDYVEQSHQRGELLNFKGGNIKVVETDI